MTMAAASSGGVIGVGYEGWPLPEFVDDLVAGGVRVMADVRLTPLARKKGFTKTALSEALVAAGIAYRHYPQLGNPKPNRAGFAGGASELSHARSVFSEWISRPDAVEAIDALAMLAQHGRVAVLCFEADPGRCHRDVVLAEVADRAVTGLEGGGNCL
jgi:uncharacterized protein (DUF488 family)